MSKQPPEQLPQIDNNHNEPNNEDHDTHEPQQKRQKTNNDESKPPSQQNPLPLAPTLEEYLTNDGHLRYSPRPEWCHAQVNPTEYYARASSIVPLDRPPHAITNRRREAFGPLANMLGLGPRLPEVHRHMERYRRVFANVWNEVEFQHQEPRDREVDMPIGGAFNPRWREEADEDEGVERDEWGMPLIADSNGVAGVNDGVAVGGEREGQVAIHPALLDRLAVLEEETEGQNNDSSVPESRVAVYGSDHDSALQLAIKHGPLEAAIALINSGANVDFTNSKGMTPLMSASLNGSVELVRALLEKGASPNAVSIRGTTALIQACHFGQLEIVQELIKFGASVDQANYKNTTALMRAAQEGHEDVVKLLLQHECFVNRRNDERMTALMLCSQRGHVKVVKMLIEAGAEIDAVTNQNSSSLMLTVKRRHFDIAKILVTAGAELMLKDNKDRTALDTAQKRGMTDFVEILSSDAQIRLMQKESRRQRNFCMVRLWNLLQSERAFIKLMGNQVTIHKIAGNLHHFSQLMCSSNHTLVLAMAMPAPVMELITSFIPLPRLYEERLRLLTSRAKVDPDSAIYDGMDLVDEVLEEGGLLEAFDKGNVSPPHGFKSWVTFQKWIGHCDVILARHEGAVSEKITCLDEEEGVHREVVGGAQVQRRSINYLHRLAHTSPCLSNILVNNYGMSRHLFEELKDAQDYQTVARKQAGVQFKVPYVQNFVMSVARMTVDWCKSRPTY